MLLEDYDITVARMLVGGVDVWLNTPLRPLEACGTSGMKAVFNGVLNCSILDGWWDEMYDSDVGWAIPSAEWQDDIEIRNDLEADRPVQPARAPGRAALLPAQRRRPAGRVAGQGEGVDGPRRSEGRAPAACSASTRPTSTSRPPAARVTCGPTATPGPRRSCVEATRSSGLAHGGRSPPPPSRRPPTPEGMVYQVTAQASLGELVPEDIEVQILYGAVDLDDELRDPVCVPMIFAGDGDQPGWRRYTFELDFDQAGNFGFTVRIVPFHRDLPSYTQLGKVAWAPSVQPRPPDPDASTRRRCLSAGSRRTGQVADAGVLVRAGPLDRADRLDGREPIEQHVEHQPDLEPGEVGAEAEVRAVPEGQVAVRGAARCRSVNGSGNCRSSKLADPHHSVTLSPAAIGLAAELGVAGGGAAVVGGGRRPPQHLLDRASAAASGRPAAGATGPGRP